MKLRIKIFDRELEAEGSEEFVDKQFRDFCVELKAEFAVAKERARYLEIGRLRSEEFHLRQKLKTVQKALFTT